MSNLYNISTVGWLLLPADPSHTMDRKKVKVRRMGSKLHYITCTVGIPIPIGTTKDFAIIFGKIFCCSSLNTFNTIF